MMLHYCCNDYNIFSYIYIYNVICGIILKDLTVAERAALVEAVQRKASIS